MNVIDIVQTAPLTAAYVTIGTDATLTAERALTGTPNQIVVTDNGAGSTVVLSTPQNLHTAATPTFASLTLSGLTAGRVVFAGTSGLLDDDAALSWDDSQKFFGVGTAAPGALFELVTQSNGVFRFTNYSNATNAPTLNFRKARGTAASALRAKSGDQLMGINATGASAVDDVTTTTTFGVGSQFRAFADEDFTAAARGSSFYLTTTPIGSTSATHQVSLSSSRVLKWIPNTAAAEEASIYFGTANVAAFGTDQNSTTLVIVGAVDESGTPTHYSNPRLNLRVRNSAATPAEKELSELAVEAFWSDASVLDPTSWFYIWDQVQARPMLAHRYVAESEVSIPDTGFAIQGVANKADMIAQTLGGLQKNNATVATYYGALVRPTFNTGGSNTNTTVHLLEVDSINTAVTGLTVNLVKASYGGSQKFLVDSTGNVFSTPLTTGSVLFAAASGQITQDNANLFWDDTNNWLGIGTAGVPISQLHVSTDTTNGLCNFDTYNSSATGPSIRGRKARNTLADPRRANTNDVLFAVNALGFAAADDATTATAGGNVGQFRFRASENYTASAQGSYFEIRTTAIGALAASIATRVVVNTTGLTIGSASAARGTTEPTNAINLFNGTAPAGTLTNGVSLYSASGDLNIMNSAGTNFRIFKSSAYTPTNVTTDRSFDANSTTIDELADVVGTLIADLQAVGLMG